jgi:acyl-CoA synthetase (AMP-forming)/AMP-acid ligase II
MVASPTTLSGLKEALDLIESREEREGCIRGLNEIRALSTGSMAVPDSVKDVWRKLRGGRPLVIMYGFTEAAGMMAMTDWRDLETREISSVRYPPFTWQATLMLIRCNGREIVVHSLQKWKRR